jgi:membrane protein
LDGATPENTHEARKSATPSLLTPRAVLALIGRTVWASLSDRVALAAAGCAFWGMMSLFPAISTMISAIGLVLDPHSIESQLHLLADFLPDPAFDLIEGRIHELLGHPRASLSSSLIVSSLLTFMSSAAGSKAMLSGVAIAYDAENGRGFLHFQAVGIAMTFAVVLGGMTTLIVLVALQPALSVLGLPVDTAELVHMISLWLLVVAFAIAVGLLYRFGPVRGPVPGRAVIPGAVLATLIWLLASEGLSFYIGRMADFGATYGSLGAVAGVMLWLYATAYAVLLGAELNAQIEAFRHGN